MISPAPAPHLPPHLNVVSPDINQAATKAQAGVQANISSVGGSLEEYMRIGELR
jgi:hypothetical protein